MNEENMENISDRELFSELFETPINSLLIHMVHPFVDKESQMFHLQINNDAIWKWREVYSRPKIVFGLLQDSLLPLGYKLTESSRDRVGNVVAASIRRFWKKIQAITDGKRRKQMKAQTWIKVAIKPDEMQCTPNDIMAELNKCCTKVEEMAAELHDKMCCELAHSRKELRCWQKAAKQTFIANTISYRKVPCISRTCRLATPPI